MRKEWFGSDPVSFTPEEVKEIEATVRNTAAEIGMPLGPEEVREDILLFPWRPAGRSRWGAVEVVPEAGEMYVTLYEGDRWARRYGADLDPDSLRERFQHLRAFAERVFDPVPTLEPEEKEYLRAGAQILYALTTLKLGVRRFRHHSGEIRKFRDFRRSRTVGVFQNLEDAHQILQDNRSDLYEEGWYPMALIEVIFSDCVYGVSRSRAWYRWDQEYEGYRPCPEPKGFERIIALGGIG